jgi:hypothetical protein
MRASFKKPIWILVFGSSGDETRQFRRDFEAVEIQKLVWNGLFGSAMRRREERGRRARVAKRSLPYLRHAEIPTCNPVLGRKLDRCLLASRVPDSEGLAGVVSGLAHATRLQ